jgi:DASH complex subunit ASK1
MSRPGGTNRNLTLTEELEKLEQSITLTLQEIDHNFSKAHRIVTTSILPLVEQYGEQSKNVWEASKFWKQFFEASANVSLSGYEELADEGETTAHVEETTQLDDTTTAGEGEEDYTQADEGNETYQGQAAADDYGEVDESLLDDPSLTGSTPRPPTTKSMRKPQFANLDSPYEKIRRELKGDGTAGNDVYAAATGSADDTMQVINGTLPDMSMTGHGASIVGAATPGRARASSKGKTTDPLLHRILDKNYRIQATPHKTTPRLPPPGSKGKGDERASRPLWADSPMSSPEMAAPKLRTNLYSTTSPLKQRGRTGGGAARGDAPRTPGVSVQTPASIRKTRDVFASSKQDKTGGAKGKVKEEITWESDDDDELAAAGGGAGGGGSNDDDTTNVFAGMGMSPPKTIQFALPPSRLMQTPGTWPPLHAMHFERTDLLVSPLSPFISVKNLQRMKTRTDDL